MRLVVHFGALCGVLDGALDGVLDGALDGISMEYPLLKYQMSFKILHYRPYQKLQIFEHFWP